MRILLGGVPFGFDNIGDEAILAAALKLFRETCPDAEFTVCTNDQEHTGRKLGIETCPPFGFAPSVPAQGLATVIKSFDLFVWCGATGLSDYPEVTLTLLRIAREHGVKTVLWNVGMNSELNPAFYSLGPGKWRTLLSALQICTLGAWDAVTWGENRRRAQGRQRIADGLAHADRVIVRDPESRLEVLACGVTREVLVGADSAIVLDIADRNSLPITAELAERLRATRKKVGVCISAQRQVTAREELVHYLDRVIEELGVDVVFVPMNPITDAQLMRELQDDMKNPQHAILLEGVNEPEEVLAFLPDLDVIVSSRLHLLILASIVHVPIIGIGRGSKVANYLKPYGLTTMGSVEDCDFSALFRETARMLEEKEAFVEKSKQVREHLLERLSRAQDVVKTLCAEIGK